MGRAGVLFAGREDGVLEVWDLLERSHEPVLTAQPSAAGIASLAFSPVSPAQAETGGRPVQQLLAIGGSTWADEQHIAWPIESTYPGILGRHPSGNLVYFSTADCS